MRGTAYVTKVRARTPITAYATLILRLILLHDAHFAAAPWSAGGGVLLQSTMQRLSVEQHLVVSLVFLRAMLLVSRHDCVRNRLALPLQLVLFVC